MEVSIAHHSRVRKLSEKAKVNEDAQQASKKGKRLDQFDSNSASIPIRVLLMPGGEGSLQYRHMLTAADLLQTDPEIGVQFDYLFVENIRKMGWNVFELADHVKKNSDIYAFGGHIAQGTETEYPRKGGKEFITNFELGTLAEDSQNAFQGMVGYPTDAQFHDSAFNQVNRLNDFIPLIMLDIHCTKFCVMII
jgi:hypothetical protein